MTPRAPRAEKMKLLREQMRRIHQTMQQLQHDARVLSLQGKQEASFRKTRAVQEAKRYFEKLNKEHKALWRAERKQR